MRLHTDILTMDQLTTILADMGGIYGDDRAPIGIGRLTEHGSRTHERAFELQLSGNSIAGGAYGTATFTTATWDEWGRVLAVLYKIDRDLICGRVNAPIYDSAWDFHSHTQRRFIAGAPTDPCLRHKWSVSPWYAACTKCSAEKVWG